MTKTEVKRLTKDIKAVIAFINWKGADFSSKKKKIIKELSLIVDYCKECECRE